MNYPFSLFPALFLVQDQDLFSRPWEILVWCAVKFHPALPFLCKLLADGGHVLEIFLFVAALTGKLDISEPQRLQLAESSKRLRNGPRSTENKIINFLNEWVLLKNVGPTYASRTPTHQHVGVEGVVESKIPPPPQNSKFLFRMQISSRRRWGTLVLTILGLGGDSLSVESLVFNS